MAEMVGASLSGIGCDDATEPGEPAADLQLDAVCRTAAALFGVRYAFVSRVGEARQWFLGREGLSLSGTPKSVAFCAHTVLGEAHVPFVVLDTHRDPRFSNHPLVLGAPFLRFYAGVPIALSEGVDAATVCIADPEPRARFGAAERQRLVDLALFVEATLRGRVAEAEADRAHRRLETSDSLLRVTLESMDQGLLMTDGEDRVRVYNRRVAGMMGVPQDLLYDGAPFEAVRSYQRAQGEFAHLPDGLRAWLERGEPAARIYDYERARPDGTVLQVRTLPLPQGGLVRTFTDVTGRRAAEERVRHMALHDALTGLPNRTLFRDRLEQAITHAGRARTAFAVLACDLDRFKAVNDSLGHPAGDALLRVVAERMQAVLRPTDTIARLGGDEFAVVLTYLDAPDEAAELAERLIAAVSKPHDLDGQSVEVGVSIGVAIATQADRDPDEVFKRADIALYEAKAAGRNTHRAFEPAAGARIATRGRLALDMKEAIRRREFHLAYQPVIDADTGAIVSFEALMRWRHPVRGEIAPGAFIALAEETGLIVPLGAWALQEACREATAWPLPLRVAVNVSPVQLRRPGLEATVLAALAASGLPAERLKLEVTESVLMQDADEVLGRLHRLRALGVLIALDDFGTGYSSLSYLRRFPFDRIKIDRAFIRDIADPDAAAIVRAVVGIGERLGMGIVAEGVETAEQLALVRREGCAQVQGFLFSPPLPPHAVRLFMRDWEGGCARALLARG
ncbi:putative bifunctional diguanylate cyclase/phosphodiesterase [Methylobacterium flocculans]|uniref:putative bifunctional diguanylate cyclase/phosphodiesterase n=1 Tax=Methylobacterium flocculans TaxID=2984843 RepID=UPI0021F29D01|nr:EAL domain-containing protein [Methylobacterium sp. FF17]